MDRLRHEMHFGAYGPGSFLRQAALAKQFGVSRTPVREALKVLESDGLLEHFPERGYRVRQRSLRELIEIIDIRALFEGFAAKLAALSSTPEAVEDLRRIAAEIDANRTRYIESASKRDFEKFATAEQAFHVGLVKASGNQFLIRLVRTVDFGWPDVLAHDAAPKPVNSLPTHEDIIDAIENGDGTTAEEHARRHVSFYKLIGVESRLGPTVYWDHLPLEKLPNGRDSSSK